MYLKLFISKLLNNPLASWSLTNFDILLSHTAHLDKRIIIPFLVLTNFGFLFSVFFLQFKKSDKSFIVLLYIVLYIYH